MLAGGVKTFIYFIFCNHLILFKVFGGKPVSHWTMTAANKFANSTDVLHIVLSLFLSLIHKV